MDRPLATGPAVRMMSAALLACIVGLPLAIAPGLLLEYEATPKLAILLCCVAAMLACWDAWWPGVAAAARSTYGRLFLGIGALQLLSLTVSTASSDNRMLSLAGSGWHRFGLVTGIALAIFFLLCASFFARHPATVRLMLTALVWTGGAIAAYAVAQYAGMDPFLARALYVTEYGGDLTRVPGTLEHGVYLGAFLAAILPVAAGLAATARKRQKSAHWALVCLLLVGVILSGTRSAVLGLLAAGAVLAFSGAPLGRKQAVALVSAAAVLGIGLVIFVRLPAAGAMRLRWMQWRQDAYGGPRLDIWRESLDMIADRPVFGFGPEAFGNEFRRRQSAALSRAFPEHFVTAAHNVLIDTAVSQGMAGLLVFAGLGWLLFTQLTASKDPYARWARAGAASLGISLIFTTITLSGMWLLYLLVAVVVSTRIPADAPRARPPGPAAKLAAAGLAFGLVAAAGAYLRQDLAFARIARAVKTAALPEMVAAYQVASAARFPSAGDDLWCSRQFALAAKQSIGEEASRAWAFAAAASERAERTSDNTAEAAFQSALLAIGANDARKAEQKLRLSIQRAPNWYKPRLLLSQLLNFTGRPGEAQAEARIATDLSHHPQP